jgi:beta-carotene ketolase (CrtW type)
MMTRRRQTLISSALAATLFAGWAVLHVGGIFFYDWTGDWGAVAAVVLLQAWLSAGMFIVAHDCMHGSFAPGTAWLNRAVGHVAVGCYAAFSYRQLEASHFRHHRHAGTEADPDFDAEDPTRFAPWFVRFFFNYYTHRQLALITAMALLYMALGAKLQNIVLFWAVPALLSALQLFLFGTWLPHRHGDDGFADRHNARSNRSGWLASLLTCFHFGGYHHEHHLHPNVPWWALPQTESASRTAPSLSPKSSNA